MASEHLLHPLHTVKHIRNVRIPMSDGVTLAADLFMPEAEGRFPAVFEYLPYRKDDRVAARWNAHHYFAERGFVGLRVDMRGTGGSEGLALDEYLPQEQLDGCEVIEWASRQAWCNGNVGMWGTSYGGFNALQVAMRRPPALKAIVPHAATDDRYNCDVHYNGGCLQGIDQVEYPGWMLPMNAAPAYPEYAGGDWAAHWLERLEGNPPWILDWLRHQVEDDYWLQGSLKTDYASIQCAVLNLGGWQDGYPDAIFRMLEHLEAPNRAIVGPWQHSRPNDAYPEPRINHLHEMTRFFAQHLRGEETGIMDEPQLAMYVQRGARPNAFQPHMPGEWRFEQQWPPARTMDLDLFPVESGALGTRPSHNSGMDRYRHRASVGTQAGFWCPLWQPFGLHREQSVDDGRSLTYTTAPLDRPAELLGFAHARLFVETTAEVAAVSVKLCDIAPDGTSALVTRGILNLTHRDGHARPEPAAPGMVYEVDVPLKVASWVFKPGHSIRLSIATSDFPTVWPTPFPHTLTLHHGGARPSRITLPVVGEPDAELPRPRFEPATALRPTAVVANDVPEWRVSDDVTTGYTSVYLREAHRSQPVGEPYMVEEEQISQMATSDERPDSTWATSFQRLSMLQPGVRTDIRGRIHLRSTATQLHADLQLKVERDGEDVFRKTWMETFPRVLL